jgi:hypothetical protein
MPLPDDARGGHNPCHAVIPVTQLRTVCPINRINNAGTEVIAESLELLFLSMIAVQHVSIYLCSILNARRTNADWYTKLVADWLQSSVPTRDEHQTYVMNHTKLILKPLTVHSTITLLSSLSQPTAKQPVYYLPHLVGPC